MPQSYPVSAIAQLLKITERRIQQLVHDGILPRPEKGNYDAIDCVHAYIDYLRRLVAGSGELSLTDERTRLTKFQADREDLELQKAKGRLIDSRKAKAAWGEVITATRQRLLGLPSRLAPIVATSQSIPEIKQRLETAIHEMLNEFANPDLETLARMDLHSGGPPDIQATAKADRKPVGRRKKKAESGE